MPEGLSPAEVGKEIAEHKKHSEDAGNHHDQHDRRLSIVEAVLLSFVAVLAAYSGYAAAKWGTESSVNLATASAERTKANRADTEGIVTRGLDSASFNAWFTALTAGHANDERLAERRMRPGYRPALKAWPATDPVHDSSSSRPRLEHPRPEEGLRRRLGHFRDPSVARAGERCVAAAGPSRSRSSGVARDSTNRAD